MSDWLSAQLEAPGAFGSLLLALAVLCGVFLPLVYWRRDRRRRRLIARREAAALAEIADYVCDLVVAVGDSLRDEVNAVDFRYSFERRQLVDAERMLEAIPASALPSLALLRPLFELRWALERSHDVAEWLEQAMDDPDREGWRETAAEMRELAERAAVAAEAFRQVAHRVDVD